MAIFIDSWSTYTCKSYLQVTKYTLVYNLKGFLFNKINKYNQQFR